MKRITTLALFFFFSFSAVAGFRPGLTRVIYDENKGEASIPVSAVNDNTHYLVQAWVNDLNNERANFVVTPPIFKLAPETQNTIRMKYIGATLPPDRETMFFLNLKAIPAKETDAKNQITIATKSIMKLLYRPKALDYKSAINAKNSLDFSWSNGNLKIKNPTAYYINFGRFFSGSTELEDFGYVKPFSEMTKPLKDKPANVRYTVIDDFGGVSEFINVKM